ncbi:MAG: patatin-like phospholipase family protein [Gammaproteobacteria bacterium]|nr:patatin-like phospholipase family protein [Gammaproteobacteria bacterium]
MKACIQLLISFALCGIVTATDAANKPLETLSSHIAKRPKIGLALSGGGARGFAHIGVLKALEELHIPVDYIAGSSMGAAIGGLYALGLSPQTMEEEVQAIPWETVFNQTAQKEYISLRNRQQRRRYFLNWEIGVDRKGKLTNPASVLWAEEFMLILKRLTRGTKETDFSKFPIPFRAVTTDLNQAKTVILDKGDLALALRASMAVPSIFAPVPFEGHLLVDGGVLNNLPVDVVKAMGANVVIAINISTPLEQVEADSSFFEIAKQSIDVALIQNTRHALEQADLVITPKLDSFFFEDFGKADAIIQKGYEALSQKAIWLHALALPAAEYEKVLAKRTPPPIVSVFEPQFVQFVGNNRTHSQLLHGQVDSLTVKPVTTDEIEQAIRKMMALNDIQHINYQIVTGKNGQQGISFEVTEKPWGPHYFRFGFNTTATFGKDPLFQGLLKHEWLNVNRYGAEWHNEVILGSKFLLASAFYQPIDFKRRFFIEPYTRWTEENHPHFQGDDEITRHTIERYYFGLDVGMNFKEVSELRGGILHTSGREKLRVGDPTFPKQKVNNTGLRLAYLYDSLDDPNFAKQGTHLSLQGLFYRPYFDETPHYQIIDFYGRRHFKLGKEGSLISDLRWGTINGKNIPTYEAFFFGGINDFAGFKEGQLTGRYAFIARVGGMTPLYNNPLSINDNLKLLTFFHAGKLWENANQTNLEKFKLGALGALVWDTPFGIVLAGVGYTDLGHVRYYLSLGNLFERYP